jgi:hypothetical protein
MFHRNQEHDILCCGDQRRRIVAAIEKFMYELQILDDSLAGPPNLRWKL